MPDQVNSNSGRSSNSVAMMIGALIVALLVIGFFVFGGSVGDGEKDVNVDVQTPGVGDSPTSGDTGGTSGETGGNTGAGTPSGGQTQ